MKQKLSTTLALVILTMPLTAATARAQTVANGPYYAPPAWDQTLPVATRFIVLSNFASAAVLDRETGLVWEKSPIIASADWPGAQSHCNSLRLGNRMGWRLPTLQELASLVDPSGPVAGPLLPPGHPFTNVLSLYWSATTFADNPGLARGMAFGSGNPIVGLKSAGLGFWCVRGGQGVDSQ
jgi:hypothetical protein